MLIITKRTSNIITPKEKTVNGMQRKNRTNIQYVKALPSAIKKMVNKEIQMKFLHGI